MREEYNEVFDKKSVCCRQKLEKILRYIDNTSISECFSIFGHAFYVFKTGNKCWAIDPCIRTSEMKRSCADLVPRLSKLDFVLITHSHDDHFDIELIRMMSEYDIHWYMPEFLSKSEISRTGLDKSKITFVSDGDTFTEGQNTFTVFKSAHFGNDNGVTKGVDEVGYYVDTGKTTLAFPCDVRDYSVRFNGMKNVNHLFLHVWLGYEKALGLPDRQMIDAFCDFTAQFSPANVYLAHLYDKRDAHSLWTFSHAGIIADELSLRMPQTNVIIPVPAQLISLE